MTPAITARPPNHEAVPPCAAVRSERVFFPLRCQFGRQGGLCAASGACLGNCRLNGARGLVRAPLMGSQGVHRVAERVRNVVMRVHKAGVTGTGRSGTL